MVTVYKKQFMMSRTIFLDEQKIKFRTIKILVRDFKIISHCNKKEKKEIGVKITLF